MLLITGNMPGRCEAGRRWQARFDRFLRGYGLQQCATDLRIWVLRSMLGVLVIHGHVDDSRLTSTTPPDVNDAGGTIPLLQSVGGGVQLTAGGPRAQ